jgi:hypothetical protein
MLFAVVAIVQVPAMAVACAAKSPGRIIHASSADDHHSHLGHHQHHADVAVDVDDSGATHHASVCQAMNCCMAVDPAVVRSPIATDLLIGLIGQAAARAMLPAPPEPADPPPRLQAACRWHGTTKTFACDAP